MVIECLSVPMNDPAFAAAIRSCMERMVECQADELSRLLRERYPRAAVRPRQRIRQADATWVWYVYRDG